MTTVTITIKDAGGNAYHIEGYIDDPAALQKEPTAALIIGTYLAANSERVCRDAESWFHRQTVTPIDAAPTQEEQSQ